MLEAAEIVTCQFWSDGDCSQNLFGGRPSIGKCRRCEQYVAQPGATQRIIQVTVMAARRLCRERLLEEWSEEWQSKLLAAATRSSSSAVWIPAEIYEQALKSRR